MIGFNIPRSHYHAVLPASARTDFIEFEVQAPNGSEHGHATLRLLPASPGRTPPAASGAVALGGIASLTHIEVSVTAPRCSMGAPSANPHPLDLTVSTPGQLACCTWRHLEAQLGRRITYEVPFRTTETRPLRFEFRIRADELKHPVVLQIDTQARGAALAKVAASKVAKAAAATATTTATTSRSMGGGGGKRSLA